MLTGLIFAAGWARRTALAEPTPDNYAVYNLNNLPNEALATLSTIKVDRSTGLDGTSHMKYYHVKSVDVDRTGAPAVVLNVETSEGDSIRVADGTATITYADPDATARVGIG